MEHKTAAETVSVVLRVSECVQDSMGVSIVKSVNPPPNITPPPHPARTPDVWEKMTVISDNRLSSAHAQWPLPAGTACFDHSPWDNMRFTGSYNQVHLRRNICEPQLPR